MRTTSPEALVELDRSRPRGLRAQVEEELRSAVRTGRLAPGTVLPSTRALAADLGVTRGVVVAAYDQLVAEGYLSPRVGSGTVVNDVPTAPVDRPPATPATTDLRVDFRPGLPDLDFFPRSAWLRATRAALRDLPNADLGYVDPRGLPTLRAALADYLQRVRGVTADPDRIVVCNGFGHGLSLVARALHQAGHTPIAVEDPGYDDPRAELAWLGIPTRPVPVDEEGLSVERLQRSRARATLVTPAHQMPTGALLSPARRTALVAWARRVDGYVLEDDYDAEYRYDRHPVGAVQGVAPDRVVYSGTSSKSLAPGLRLGWLVLPAELVAPVVDGRQLTDHATASITQATYAAFLTNGDLDRHLRRTRLVYRQRRDALVDALTRHLPEARAEGIAAGLTILVRLPDGADEVGVVERALARGVRANALRRYRATPAPGDPPALVLGYGAVTPAESDEGVRLLAEALRP